MSRKQRLEHIHRSEAAKTAWKFRKAHAAWVHKKRSEAAKKGWLTRRRRVAYFKREPEFEEIEVRVDYGEP